MIDHDVKRLHISVHDAMEVRIFQRLQNHVGVESDVHVVEATGQYFRLNVGDVFKNKRWCLGTRVSENIIELDDVGTTVQCLQDLDLAILFFDSNGFENFYDTLLIIGKVSTLKDFRVFAAA